MIVQRHVEGKEEWPTRTFDPKKSGTPGRFPTPHSVPVCDAKDGRQCPSNFRLLLILVHGLQSNINTLDTFLQPLVQDSRSVIAAAVPRPGLNGKDIIHFHCNGAGQEHEETRHQAQKKGTFRHWVESQDAISAQMFPAWMDSGMTNNGKTGRRESGGGRREPQLAARSDGSRQTRSSPRS